MYIYYTLNIFLKIINFSKEVFVFRTQKCYKLSFDEEIIGKVRFLFFWGARREDPLSDERREDLLFCK